MVYLQALKTQFINPSNLSVFSFCDLVWIILHFDEYFVFCSFLEQNRQ